MDRFWEEICTLVSKSGGVESLESVGAQRVRGVALFLEDGRVAVFNCQAQDGGCGAMKDTAIKGSGNSRTLKSVSNLAQLAPTWEKALELFTGEGFPVDIGALDPAGCLQIGTDLNKASLLKDATAALYPGLPEDPVPDDVLAAIMPLINTAMGRGRIECVSYTGTFSDADSRKPPLTKTIIFPFTPYLVVIYGYDRDNIGFFTRPGMFGVSVRGGSYAQPLTASWTGNSLKITSNSTDGNAAIWVFNRIGTTYNAIAIG